MPNTISSLVHELQHGQQDLYTYLNALIDRVEAGDKEISAFLPEHNRRERLLKEAERLIQQYPDASNRPALFGLPIGVKDIFRVDGFPTHCGSRLPAELFEGTEAVSVTRLKQAGALILGKTVTTEFACFSPGPTRNPHNHLHTPGGSSSGSAAAVSAAFCPLALGSQTIGSIIRPAAYCGVVGYKPTYDRIPKEGVIPVSSSVDTMGVFTRSVEDTRLIASVLCKDWRNISLKKRPVLGIPDGPYIQKAYDEGRDHFQRACTYLTDIGFIVKTIPSMADFEDIEHRHKTLMAYEAAKVHQTWYETYRELYSDKMQTIIETGHTADLKTVAYGLDGCNKLGLELASLAEQHGIDLWISPPAQGPAPAGLHFTGDPIMNLPWTHAGLPTMTLPYGSSKNGLPMGIQLTAGRQEDERLLDGAAQIEKTLVATK